MQPHIDRTKLGSITIDDQKYDEDIVIRRNGAVVARKFYLPKRARKGTRVITREEARFLCEDQPARFVIGRGRAGTVKLSEEARDYLQEIHCLVELLSTPDAIEVWNHVEEPAVGLFHVTA